MNAEDKDSPNNINPSEGQINILNHFGFDGFKEQQDIIDITNMYISAGHRGDDLVHILSTLIDQEDFIYASIFHKQLSL